MVRACRIAVIGGGPAGVMTAALLDRGFDVTIFEPKGLLLTLLPTGGGKCNITNSESDYRSFAANYPRGEKFLYSALSRYSSADAAEYFKSIGVNTIVMENGRVFPEKMSAKFVRERMLSQIKHCNIEKTAVTDIQRKDGGFCIICGREKYFFDKVIVTAGGHCNFNFLNSLAIKIIPVKPALTGLITVMNYCSLSGVVLKDIYNSETGEAGDLLFTHFGISGPLVFRISSIKAQNDFPYKLHFDLLSGEIPSSKKFQNILNMNSKKGLKNVLSLFLPKNFVNFFLTEKGYSPDMPAGSVNARIRDGIFEYLKNYEIEVKAPKPDGETVMAGGVDLACINSKSFEHKSIQNLYFAGEILDIDGFCGGFNLQNCWSGAFAVAEAINAV